MIEFEIRDIGMSRAKRLIDNIKTILIGSAILDLYMEQNNKSIRTFPSLNYYYYKLKPDSIKYGDIRK